MGTTVTLRNIVGETEHGLLVGVGPLHRHLNDDTFLIRVQADHVGMQRGLQLGQMLHEGANTTLVGERVMPPFSPFVLQLNGDTGVEEGQFAQTLGQDVVVKLDIVGERGWAGQEAHQRPAPGRRPDHLERIQRLAQRVFLLVFLPAAVNRQPQVVAECIHHRHAHAVQAAGDLVGVRVELAAGVQHGHHHFGGGTALFRMNVHRDAAAVIADTDRAIVENGDHNGVAITGQRLIDRVVNDFKHHVMQASAIIGVADVHAGALAHRFQTFQYLDVA